ncbi:hypothetical protein FOZ61_005753 [Perkinsus olseni]|uniref:Uncharacterized protein n=1 Tax=Perkinsus olseni TaxID=32597 RepID=A0A7J6LGE0_PEROL|nr:hypothetical protein FOZ61_005753 [Perkinsus olseni]KAF4664935.1 hypothetical protein FOL46_003954 [Perkinsus olseni]
MCLRLIGMYLMVVGARCALFDGTYTLYSTDSGEPDIQRFQFTSQQGGKVLVTSIKGHLPKGQYDCEYDLDRSSGDPRYPLTLKGACNGLVMDSSGYYDNDFLNGCSVEHNYQYLYVPIATTGYDIYQSNNISTTTTKTPTPTTTPPATTSKTTPTITTTTLTTSVSTTAVTTNTTTPSRASCDLHWGTLAAKMVLLTAVSLLW